jgi:ABC-type antimicrobial peptide transport system permease subunit
VVPTVYARYPQGGALYTTTYALKTEGDPALSISAVRKVFAEAGTSVEGDVTTGIEYRDRTIQRERLLASLLLAFAAAALLLSCLGVYGLIAYTASSRTPEIGVRATLGARRSQVVRLIMTDSLLPVAIGLLIGAITATILTSGIEALLFGVSATEGSTFAAAASLLTAFAAAAALVPSVRASRIDAMQALRLE